MSEGGGGTSRSLLSIDDDDGESSILPREDDVVDRRDDDDDDDYDDDAELFVYDDAPPDRSDDGPSPRRSTPRREIDDDEDGDDVDRDCDPKNDDAVDGTRPPSSPDASTSSPSSGSPRQIQQRRRQPQQPVGGAIEIDVLGSRPKNPRMQTFAYLNRPVVEVRIIGIVLLSCFLQAIDTLAGLPDEVHRGIGVVDTVCVYVFAIEFFLRWWSAGRFQLRYLSKPLVSIDAVRERERDLLFHFRPPSSFSSECFFLW